MTTYSTERSSLISAANLDIMANAARNTPPGDFVEVGVYRGGSARELYKVAEEQNRKLFLCDTFTGHPRPSEYDEPTHPLGRYADCADPQELQLELPNAWVVIGPFPWSYWRYFNILPLERVAFAHVDVDLYESTHETIKLLQTLMVRGGLIYVDDYGEVQGATKAVDDLLPDRKVLANGKAVWRR